MRMLPRFCFVLFFITWGTDFIIKNCFFRNLKRSSGYKTCYFNVKPTKKKPTVLQFCRFLFLKATFQKNLKFFHCCNEQCLWPIKLIGLVVNVVFLLTLLFGSLAVLSWDVYGSHTWDIPQGTLLNDALSQSVVNCSGRRLAKPWVFTRLLEAGSAPKETFSSPFNIPRRTAGGQCIKGSQPPLSLAILGLCVWEGWRQKKRFGWDV